MRLARFLVLAAAAAQPALAQTRDTLGPTPVLSLDDAITIAQRSNPTLLRSVNQRDRAGTALRTAYGELLPSLSSSFSSSYREGRQTVVEGQRFGSASDVVSSVGRLNLGVSYSPASLLGPRYERANVDAADANVVASRQTVRSLVTQQYLTVLQQQARAALQDTLVASAQAQLDLAKARAAVGAATTLEVRRAEVAVGQAQVASINARNQVEVEKLRLFQQMGIEPRADVRLTTTLPVTEPTFTVDDLLGQARRGNPTLAALRSQERAASLNVKRARGSYLPTVSLGTSYGGTTSQQTDIESAIASQRLGAAQSLSSCLGTDSLRRSSGLPSIAATCESRFTFTDADAARMRSDNRQFPFGFARDPYTFSVSLSLPIFDNFSREQRVQDAAAQRADVQYQIRAQALQLTADVTAAYLNLKTALETVRLQEQNAQAAREALALSQERFRVGASSYVELAQARSDFERAETDRINAVYDYHKAYAVLEGAVGRPLR